jgi:protein ImuB
VEVREGELCSARLLGKRRLAIDISGPERLQGDWWSNHAYARDYYRVVFDGLGPVWLFRDARDGRFYLHGMFD